MDDIVALDSHRYLRVYRVPDKADTLVGSELEQQPMAKIHVLPG